MNTFYTDLFRTITVTATLGQGEPGNNSDKGLHGTSHIFRTGASPTVDNRLAPCVELFVCLIFYGISNFVGYFLPNLFLYK